MTIKSGINDVKKQIEYFLSPACKNKDLSIQQNTAEEIIKEGWVKKRIDNLFEENKYSNKDIAVFFKEFMENVPMSQMGLIEINFPEQEQTTLSELLQQIKKQFVIEFCNLQISNHLKEIKNQTIN